MRKDLEWMMGACLDLSVCPQLVIIACGKHLLATLCGVVILDIHRRVDPHLS